MASAGPDPPPPPANVSETILCVSRESAGPSGRDSPALPGLFFILSPELPRIFTWHPGVYLFPPRIKTRKKRPDPFRLYPRKVPPLPRIRVQVVELNRTVFEPLKKLPSTYPYRA
jgi:hypothetical protein